MEDRIDFNYNYQQDTDEYKKVDQLFDYAEKLIEKVFKILTVKTGNRIAFNAKGELEAMTDQRINKFMNKFSSPLSIYETKKLVEWEVRFNAHETIEWNNKIEDCNCITELSKVMRADMIEENRIMVSIDVNTLQQKTSDRFKYDDMLGFSKEAKSIVNNIILEIEGNI